MIYIVSNIRGSIDRAQKLVKKVEIDACRKMAERDCLIVCGDLFSKHEEQANEKLLEWLSEQPFTVLFVDGDEDSATFIAQKSTPTKRFGNRCRRLGKDVLYLETGRVYEIPINQCESRSFLALGGAATHSFRWCSSKNPQSTPIMPGGSTCICPGAKVDYVVSHDIPSSKMGILNMLFKSHVQGNVLEDIVDKISFQQWFFGHYRFDLETAKDFRCVNRSPRRIN